MEKRKNKIFSEKSDALSTGVTTDVGSFVNNVFKKLFTLFYPFLVWIDFFANRFYGLSQRVIDVHFFGYLFYAMNDG